MRPVADITGFLPHPVNGAPIVFAVLFAIIGVLHAWQSSKYKSWPYTWAAPCACIIFTASFICREYTVYNPESDATFTAIRGLFYSAAFIITIPLYLALYGLLTIHSSPIIIRSIYWLIIISFTSTLISITSQATAAFFNPDASAGAVSSGLAMLQASLVMQLFLNFAFIVTIAILYRYWYSQVVFQPNAEQRAKTLINIFLISITLLLIRNIFSTTQSFLPSNSAAWTVEAYFWVFEVTPLLAYAAFFLVLYPAKYLYIRGGTSSASRVTDQADDIGLETGKI